MNPSEDTGQPEDDAQTGDSSPPAPHPAIRMPELPEDTPDQEDPVAAPVDAPVGDIPPENTDGVPYSLPALPYEYVHPACGGVAFRMEYPALPPTAVECAHCAAGLAPRAMSRRHIRETRPDNKLT